LLVAAVTAVMAKSLFSSAGAPAEAAQGAPQPDGPQVLVATRALPVGTILQADSFRYQPWPKELIQEAYYIKGDVKPPQPGTVVRYAITAGQPITQGALVKPGDSGFLAAALGPGMRAVTVPVSAQSGVAGFVFPGDRIDLVLTQTVSGTGDGPPLKASETFVRNIRVLATDQRYTDKDDDGKQVVKEARNVTIEVTPRIAEKIAVAQSIGTLSLSLRSISDQASDVTRAVASGEVKVPEGTDPTDERKMLAAWANRPNDTNTTYTTGGDVSRFQRRTVPTPAAAPAAPAGTNGAPSQSAAVVSGPVVRVARGNEVTVVPVGAH
jgi:pilus assembly protein CpaB